MDIKRLEIFAVVAEEQSFTRAAQKLYTSQPAVSIQIKLLEQETGLKLFDRIGKKIKLTKEGELIYVSAQKLRQGVKEADEIVRELKAFKKGSVRIAASSTPGVYLLPNILGNFKKRYPDIHLTLFVSNSDDVVQNILSGECHLGFTGRETHDAHLKQETFSKDIIVPVFQSGYSLLKKKNITLAILAREPFILREKGSATRAMIEEAFKERNLQLQNIVMEAGNTEGVKRAVIAGMGISFLSFFSITEELQQKKLFTLRKLPLSLHRNLNIIYRRNAWLSPSIKLFLQFCREHVPQFKNMLLS